MKEPQVSIPVSLWTAILRYHVADQRDAATTAEIAQGIEDKIERQVRHELYTTYKSAGATEEERAAARDDYLQRIGLRDSFRK